MLTPSKGKQRPNVSVLSVAPPEDQIALADALDHSPSPLCVDICWKLAACHTLPSALRLLGCRTMPIIVCDCDFGQCIWIELLEHLEQLPARPALIVTSRTADERLWAEALNRGVYDVLAKPFDAGEVVRTLSLAWLRWVGQRDQAGNRSASAYHGF